MTTKRKVTRVPPIAVRELPPVPAFDPFARYHWFMTSALSWVADDDITRGLARLRKIHAADWKVKDDAQPPIALWRVPGSNATAAYGIANYRPSIDGAVLVGYVDLSNVMGN